MSTGLNDPNRCPWCDGFHTGKCPLVKSMEFHADGVSLKRVEFYAPSDYQPLQASMSDQMKEGARSR